VILFIPLAVPVYFRYFNKIGLSETSEPGDGQDGECEVHLLFREISREVKCKAMITSFLQIFTSGLLANRSGEFFSLAQFAMQI
jgi:hypothetical protein